MGNLLPSGLPSRSVSGALSDYIATLMLVMSSNLDYKTPSYVCHRPLRSMILMEHRAREVVGHRRPFIIGFLSPLTRTNVSVRALTLEQIGSKRANVARCCTITQMLRLQT